METLKKELTVETSELSATTRKKTSAPDERKSAQVTGAVGVAFMVLTFAIPVVLDMDRVIAFVRSLCKSDDTERSSSSTETDIMELEELSDEE